MSARHSHSRGRGDYSKACLRDGNVSEEKDPYVRCYVSLFKNSKFENLSVHAQNLYFRIAVQCAYDRERRLMCVFPKSEYTKHFSARTFRKAREELLEGGFIKQRGFTGKGEWNQYRLSDAWHKYQGSVPESERYY